MPAYSDDWIIERIIFFIPLLLSLTVHEWAHAWSAWMLGDDTAMRLGRLTLNPIAHMDPVGTFLLPLLGVPFGWAKPVPFNPIRFRRDVGMGTGMLLVALAGPVSNVCLALAAAAVLSGIAAIEPETLLGERGWLPVFQMFILLNLALAFFNMLPIPPLDGSRIVDALMPRSLRPAWDQFAALGPVLLVAVLVLPPLMGVNLFAGPMRWAQWLTQSSSS